MNGPALGLLQDLDAFAYEALTISSTAVALTAATYAPSGAREALVALITVEANTIRYRQDGTAPTATEGHQRISGNESVVLIYGRQNIRNFRAIRQDVADATIRITYFR